MTALDIHLSNSELRRALRGHDHSRRPGWLPAPSAGGDLTAPPLPEGRVIGREGQSTGRQTDQSGTITERWTLPDGTLHRDGGRPALTERRPMPNGSVLEVIEYRTRGDLHRDGDLPAKIRRIVDAGGQVQHSSEQFYVEGVAHRDGGPQTVSTRDGQVTDWQWRRHGLLDRGDDEPAVMKNSGKRYEWYRDGKCHRDGGLPAVLRDKAGESVEYWQDGKRHRDGDRPAIVLKGGTVEYFTQGKRHRDGDLPAVYRPAADTKEWWVDGRRAKRPDGRPNRTLLDGVTPCPHGNSRS